MTWSSFESLLVAEAAKKSSVAWVSVGGGACPVWTAWADGAMYFAAGGSESPVPGIEAAAEVTVWLRASDGTSLLTAFRGRLEVLEPDTEDWWRAVEVLAPSALNTPDRDLRVATWRSSSKLARVTPTEGVSREENR